MTLSLVTSSKLSVQAEYVIQPLLSKPNKKRPSVSTGGFFDIGQLELQQVLAATKYPLVDVGVFTNTPELKNKTDDINPKSVKYL